MQNKDLEIARKYRDDNDKSLVIVKNEKIIFTSTDFGIKPLYLVYQNNMDADDACVADKVIGLGAAMIMAHIGVKSVHTYIISKSALDYLHNANIIVLYDNIVDFIENRKKNGKCPVETMAEKSESREELLVNVEKFLKELELI